MTVALEPLRIGEIKVSPPAALASLAGYTDLPYRLLCRELGAPYCATEMMLDRQLLLPGKLRRRLVHTHADDHPVGGQIIGNDSDVMAAAATEICRSGFDVVDVNFACPARKVLARRRGGFLLKQPELACRIVRAVLAAADRPVTLKLRMAFDAEDTSRRSFWRIAEAAFDAGAAAVCVHARTVQQRYAGPADWDFIAAVKRHFSGQTIIGSGDVTGPPAAVAMIEQTGVDGVVFARAALGNPWIFRQLQDHLAGRCVYRPPLAEQRRVLQRHFDGAFALYGQRRGPRIMRKAAIKYARQHPTPAAVRAAFVAVKTAADWQAALENFYSHG